ncbi:polyketide cyclase [Streptomyces tateyamensis]|uniref:Polyketide cyclase n=2 Tax=Streptomyces tateyamensis TaxID=565073 RepID=A0A2V4N0E9_9ACTN|nr:polyketide cyclase [Streptomyces tateyamensis]
MAAAPEAVWAVLVDVQGWRKWTASVELIRRREQGRPFALGSEAWVKQPRLPGALWRVTGYEAGRAFTWESRSPGVRTVADHQLRPTATGTELILELRQEGFLAPLARLLLGRLIRRYLAMEAAGLKAYCEGLART